MKDIIKKEMISAMKSKDSKRLSIIRLINGKITEYMKENENASEDKLVSVLDSMVKERKKTIDIYNSANESEKAESEQYEIDVISEFLPERMSTDEIRVVVTDVISKVNANSMKDMGKVMGMVKGQIGSNADPSDIASVVKSCLV